MSLSISDIQRIARLARIALTEEEHTAVQGQLNQIFSLIEEMRAVDTEGVSPMAHAQDVALRLRDDAVTEENRRTVLQSVAPQVEQGVFLVPRVIE